MFKFRKCSDFYKKRNNKKIKMGKEIGKLRRKRKP
jgi:hypothetical protein